ncbi:MAG: site-specific DNA-methyltransferase [Burkholderiales bacterium]|nr:site-specific DNA-methyltransferase [Burkholderiales bacterium]
MPEIVFKGKEYVYNHHLTVPYRPLLADKSKGVGPEDLSSNLIIHGDNLHALKALLPRYAGAVDLVFIDPPYNTGNEGWCYNDNVNSPIMREWLSTNPVDGEDMLRHDKWLCMMWPRLVLLRELMSDSGSIWITLDDNEVHHARAVLDEIFGADNFLAHLAWEKVYSPRMDSTGFSKDYDAVLVYAKSKPDVYLAAQVMEQNEKAFTYTEPETGKRARLRTLRKEGSESLRKDRENCWYAIAAPDGTEIWPIKPDGTEGRWRWEEPTFHREMKKTPAPALITKDETGAWGVFVKQYFKGEAERPVSTLLRHDEFGHTHEATEEIKQIFGEKAFDTPKPVRLLEGIVNLACPDDGLVLDSFAGSATTAHAVLKANAKDGGRRKFILVEGEAYADKLTAERVRRAIKGYAWVGNQREVLLEAKINFTQFKKADQWLAKIEAIKVKEGFSEPSAQMELEAGEPERFAPVKEEPAKRAGDTEQNALAPRRAQEAALPKKKRFDKLNIELKDGILKVEGEKRISERVDGLGGEFTYCTLGEPLDIEKLLSGEHLPAFDALGAWLFHTATGGTLLPAPKDAPQFYLGEAKDAHVWLMYEPSLNFLKSPDAALTLSRAKSFAEWGRARKGGVGEVGRVGKRHLVFAPAKYLSNKQLLELGVDYAPLPFALYREG